MIFIIPTDTVYGIAAPAADQQSVEKVFAVKNRQSHKPMIIVISEIGQLTHFGVVLTAAQLDVIDVSWPGPVSIILPAPNAPEYLHRGTHSLAFRLPADTALREFIEQHGPLVAPSANPEGSPPATTIEQARSYFGDQVDEYIDGGVRDGRPSRLIRIGDDGEVEILRD